MGAAFKKGGFPASVRLVDVRQADVVCAPVVAGEDHQGVVVNAVIFQRLYDPADAPVQGLDHGHVHPHAMVGNFRMSLNNGIKILLFGLEGAVDAPVRQEKKEGPVLVGLDHLDGFIRVVVGEITVRRKTIASSICRVRRRAVVKLDIIRPSSPQHHVNGAVSEIGIDHIRRVFRKIEATSFVKTLVKPLVFRPHKIFLAKMPFADVGGMIACILQLFGKSGLGLGHTQHQLLPLFQEVRIKDSFIIVLTALF